MQHALLRRLFRSGLCVFVQNTSKSYERNLATFARKNVYVLAIIRLGEDLDSFVENGSFSKILCH